MIVYHKTKAEFINDVREDILADEVESAVRLKLGRRTPAAELKSWRNSSQFMRNVLDDDRIPATAGVALEYQIPNSMYRIDTLVSGCDGNGGSSLVVVELKQWSQVEVTARDAMVKTYVGGRVGEHPHPSYQAWSYASLLRSFNAHVYENEVGLHPCAFLHNYPAEDGGIVDPRYAEHIERAPVFRKSEGGQLADFIFQRIRTGDSGDAIYEIESSEIRPSKALADSLAAMLAGREEFVLIDEQKTVCETVLGKEREHDGTRNVIIVEGGPGTGKSVVSINLLVEAGKERWNSQYVSRNSAPREVYKAKLAGTLRKTDVDTLFKGSGSYIESRPKEINLLIVDEAHRLNEKSGIFRKGENQIKEIIHASRTSVFFIDPNQRVTFLDIGSVGEIERWADHFNANTTRMELPSQFRCAGSDGYLGWVDSILGIRDTANPSLDETFDFRVFDDPVAMRKEILRLDSPKAPARMLAGYCWEWRSKVDRDAYDIEFPEHGFKERWNDVDLGQSWIMHDESVEQIGCIHTSQGLEAAYVGVIIGPDLRYESGGLVTYPLEHPPEDRNFSGLRTMIEEDPEGTGKLARELILNTYRILLTRGMKGCFVYCTDAPLRDYLRESMSKFEYRLTSELANLRSDV